jgi:hypothetical protein
LAFFPLEATLTATSTPLLAPGTLLLNTGEENTATGAGALLSNTSGVQNTANGGFALFSNTDGCCNTATGYQALNHNTVGGHNTATGFVALNQNTTGSENTALGEEALFSNTEGVNNTATGSLALVLNTNGSFNTANGSNSLLANTTGSYNTASGYSALSNNSGSSNTASGYSALSSNSGDNNTATGVAALQGNGVGRYNTANGFQTLYNNTSGSINTAIGDGALYHNTTGTGNVALGGNAGAFVTTGRNNVYIGYQMSGVADESNACYIASIFGQTSVSGVPVFINSVNKLGTATSSKRFKEDIQPMDKSSEALLALKPVRFRYKKEIDPAGRPQFGLVAEEVEKINPELVVRDKDGKPYTVRYDQVNAMLLNEFLKEHKRVQAQQATISELKSTVAQQKKGMEVLTAQLKEQAAALQKVSDQLEMNRPAPHLVVNP